MPSSGFIGQIALFAGSFDPRGWAACEGQLLAISSHSALYGLLGTAFGGDGRTTFALPDLRGRVPIHAGVGKGHGLSDRHEGESGGRNEVVLTIDQLPEHNHLVNASGDTATHTEPRLRYWAKAEMDGDPKLPIDMYSQSASNTMAPNMAQMLGNGEPHTNLPPFGALRYVICLTGVMPTED